MENLLNFISSPGILATRFYNSFFYQQCKSGANPITSEFTDTTAALYILG
jgi:hypothetical protein